MPQYSFLIAFSFFSLQFMNKVLYKEGAKIIMDRTFADFPWQVRVEVDGVETEVPEVSCWMYPAFSKSYFCVRLGEACCVPDTSHKENFVSQTQTSEVP